MEKVYLINSDEINSVTGGQFSRHNFKDHTFYVTDKFVKDIEADSTNLKNVFNDISRALVAYDNLTLGLPHSNGPVSFYDIGVIEGRLKGKTRIFYYLTPKACILLRCYNHTKSGMETDISKNAKKILDSVISDCDFVEDDEQNTGSIFDEVKQYLESIGVDLTDDELDYLNNYISQNGIKSIHQIIYKLDSLSELNIFDGDDRNEYFVSVIDESLTEARKQSALKSNGIYSVLHDKWIKEPVQADIPDIDEEAFNNLFAEWEARYLDIVGGASFEDDSPEMIIEKATEKIKFHYHGPVYRFEHVFKSGWDAYTEAATFKKAVSNLNAKAKQEFGFTVDAKMNIDPDYLEVVDTEPAEEDGIEIKHCEKCGRRLNDSGECPLCDLGDESVLDEEIKNDKIEEIEDFIEDVYDLRKTSIAEDGEYGIGNLVFKELRNLGYLDNLKELKNQLKSKDFSLHEHLSREQLKARVPNITEEDVMSWINPKVGWDMTIDPDTLKKADFSKLPKGWIVTQNFGLDNLFDQKDYQGMTDFIKRVLLTYGDKFYIGTYKMKFGRHRGKIAIDVNKIIPDTYEAILDGIKNKQESIYRYDEYIFLTHNTLSRRDGDKADDPFTRKALEEYGLDTHVVEEPIKNCFNIRLVDGIVPTDIPAKVAKK